MCFEAITIILLRVTSRSVPRLAVDFRDLAFGCVITHSHSGPEATSTREVIRWQNERNEFR